MQNVPIAMSQPDPARGRSHALDAEGTARKAAEAALDRKAENLVVVDLREKATYADFLVICSGSNERQLEAIADAVEKSLHDAGQRLIGSEGARGSRWVLLDFGDVVVHVFHHEERAYYDLEGLWSDAKMTRL
ncbi:MAG TPA: ribosome silencing factor [Myxococcales bacterium]|jgi:ribosome-associated protein|nr:ribosome silencing factor [Myxococcales bacterium]